MDSFRSAFNARVVVLVTTFLLSLGPAMSEEPLRVPLRADIGTFDPDNGFETGAMSVINNVYEGLVQYAPGTVTIVGRLARSWRISEDGRRYVFDLVEGVKFHDGSDMTAASVVTSFNRRREGSLALSYMFANVEGISAIAPQTLEIVLRRAQPSFLDGLAGPWGPKVIGPKALSEHQRGDESSSWINEHADGTGPYQLKKFDRGSRYVLERNDSYWGKKGSFSEIVLPVIPDMSQQILQLQAGDIDAVPTGYPFAQLRGLPRGLAISRAPSTSLYTLFSKPGSPFDDPEIRQAILTAINPSAWVSDAFGEYATTAKSIYPKIILVPKSPLVFPSDLDRAKEIVSRRGPVTLVIGLHSTAPGYQRISGLLLAQLASVGIEATAYPLPPGAAYNLKDSTSSPDFLLTIAGPDAAHPEYQARAFFTKDAPINFFGRFIEEADLLFDRAGALTDLAQRDDLYERAGRMIVEKGIAVPLIEVEDVAVHADGLSDLGLRPVYPPGNIDFGSVRR